jgi:flavorubredoxin
MNQELPIRFCEPERVAPDTWVVRQLAGEGLGPVATYVNSSVITGAEPVIVDCGPAVTRDQWLETTFSIVDPADVRWIYLSHDDPDHTGNLLQVLDACPDATLVTTAFMMERMSAEFGMALPLPRMRWVNDGDRIDAGDRELVAVTPPTFDSPTTRGLFDTKTSVYWASDAMGSPVPHEVDDIAELDHGFWREGFLGQQLMLSPWLHWTSPERYDAVVDRVRTLGASVVTSAHGPALRGTQIESACRLLRELPYLRPVRLPGQVDLDATVAMLVQAAQGAGVDADVIDAAEPVAPVTEEVAA